MIPNERTDTGRRRLLIVDDSRLILEIVSDFFSPHGYEVIRAENGRLALEALCDGVPDIIVADILMPEMDGWALFEEIRRRPDTADVPFVFLTVESDLPKRLRGFRLGADDYLTKPFAIEELHARVDRILERRSRLARTGREGDSLLSGTVEHLAISDLLQILALNGKSAVVRLQQGSEEGEIVFLSGRMVHAACGPAAGTKALFRMLGWSSATFRVLPPSAASIERTIDAPASNALMDGLISLDEWNRWRGLIPPADARLELAPDARNRLHGQAVSPAEFDVMARAKEGAAVGAILDASPLPDADLAEAMCTLITRGVVRATP
jgi:CheY-like chemotaxis protein